MATENQTLALVRKLYKLTRAVQRGGWIAFRYEPVSGASVWRLVHVEDTFQTEGKMDALIRGVEHVRGTRRERATKNYKVSCMKGIVPVSPETARQLGAFLRQAD